MSGTSFDDGLAKIIDTTTSSTYTYIHKAMEENASRTAAVWLTKRIPNAGGRVAFANSITDFSRPDLLMTVAEGLSATYAS